MENQNLPKFDRKHNDQKSVYMGVDITAITDMVENALVSIDELLQHPDYGAAKAKLRADLSRVLSSQRVALHRVTFPLPNTAIPDMTLSVDIRKKNISVQSVRSAKKRAVLNSVLRTF